MNFVQVGDIHFDIPFTTISDRADLGEKRRIEQRNTFKKVIEFIKENNVECLFLCGDLFEHEYIRKSTIDYINKLFMQILNTKIYIVPGNHDPLVKDSYYCTYEWSQNVKIFTENVEVIEKNDCDIYAYGFNEFEMKQSKIDNIDIKNKEKFNILLTHGDLYNKSIYNPIDINEVKRKGFDYIAIGHIHKRDDYYSGSLISLGFDELGEHGFIYGEIENNKLNRRFIKVDEREFIVKELDVTNLNSKEEIIERLNEIHTKNNLYEIKLIGQRSIETSINIKLIQENIIKIKDCTKLNTDIKLKENEKTLTGFFVKKLNERLEKREITQEEYEKVMELANEILTK